MPARKRAAFLDRDGVLNVDRGYVCSPERFAWVPGAVETVQRLNDLSYLVVVVTNQAGIARGYYSEDDFRRFTAWISAQLQEMGGRIDATYHCPHHPSMSCACRKPAPGLLLQAMAELEIDPNESFLIGDKASDMQAAAAASVAGYLFSGGNLLEFLVKNVLIVQHEANRLPEVA